MTLNVMVYSRLYLKRTGNGVDAGSKVKPLTNGIVPPRFRLGLSHP